VNLTGLYPQPPYPWFNTQWSTFTQQVAANRLPHALLLSGQDGIGCESMAHAMAQFLLCSAPLQQFSCGRCKSCLLLQADSHPDLLQVTLEEKAKAIKVQQIRQVSEVTANTAQQGGRKVVVIHPAEAMNANSANALLKNLEEPNGDCVFILVTEQPALLMATIRSRCSKILASTPSIEESLGWLQRNQVANAERLLGEVGGRPLRVIEWLENDTWSRRNALRHELVRLLSTDASFLDCSKALLSQDLEWVLEQIHAWLSQALLVAMANKLVGEDDPLLSLLQRLPPQRLFSLYDTVTLKKRHLSSGANPNPQLLLDEITMDLKECSRN
jgi:DNA polymerase III subunit delta'